MADGTTVQTAGTTQQGTTGDGAGNTEAYKGLQRDLNAKNDELKALKVDLEAARAGTAKAAELEKELSSAKADKAKLEKALQYKDVDLKFFFDKGISPDAVDDEFVQKIKSLGKEPEGNVQAHNPVRGGRTEDSDSKKLLESLPSLLLEGTL